MTLMFEEPLFSLNPVQFFSVACDCQYLPRNQTLKLKTHALPSTHRLTQEEPFAKLGLGWHEEGLNFLIEAKSPFLHSLYPKIENGDSVELFIDTRDLKTAGFNTRFCHHFFFLPQTIDGHRKGEITHFRTEDLHALCDPEQLHCDVVLKKGSYQMNIFIPSQCLYGYDPKQFDRLGFTYRINRMNETSQHFSVVSKNYQIDQQPSLWGSLKLVHAFSQ